MQEGRWFRPGWHPCARLDTLVGVVVGSRSKSLTAVWSPMISSSPHVVSGIEYAVCQAGDTSEVGRLLAESFTQHDPPAMAVGLSAAEFEAFVKLWLPGAGTDGLTILARDVPTGQLAGALLTDDAAGPPPQGLDGLSEKFEPIFDLLGQLDTDYREGRTIVSGQYLHLFLLGVAHDFTRRSIASNLVVECLANGAVKGFTSAVTEATNPVSQHIFGQLGFKKRAERSYGKYRLDGFPVFASITEHGGPMTMDRAIRA